MDSTIPELTEQKIVEKLQIGDQHDRQPNGAKIHNVPGIERLSREQGKTTAVIKARRSALRISVTVSLLINVISSVFQRSKAVMAIAQAKARK